MREMYKKGNKIIKNFKSQKTSAIAYKNIVTVLAFEAR